MYQTGNHSPRTDMMVQIVDGRPANGHCPQPQSHIEPVNGPNARLQRSNSYYLDGYSQNNQLIQTYQSNFYQMMGVEIPIRKPGYNGQGPSSGHYNRRGNYSANNQVVASPQHFNNRPNGNGYGKKAHWNRSKRNGNKEFVQKSRPPPQRVPDNYYCDSGLSSPSPTLSKNHTEGSQTESSDDRSSVSSSLDQDVKKSKAECSVHPTANVATNHGLVGTPNLSLPNYYPNQRDFNYYINMSPGTLATPNAPSTPSVRTPQSHGKRRCTGKTASQMTWNNTKKLEGMFVPTFNFVYPRTNFAPDRFLARSHLIHVGKQPKDLLQHSQWDHLSQDIWKKFISNQQTENTFKNKMMLWKYLYIYIKTIYPKYGLFLVGSTMNGFGSDTSDVDMCLLATNVEIMQKLRAIEHLQQVMVCLQQCNFIDGIQLIRAKVPILKFHDAWQNLEVDLNCNNAVGIRNTHMLYCYSQIDWRVRPLVLVVKLWAQCQEINDAKNMTISSYSLALMVIHFLQCGVSPNVLPCLHSLFSYKFNPNTDIHDINIHEELDIPAKPLNLTNRQPLGELLYQFFMYYSEFDFSMYAISVRLANKVPIDDCRFQKSWKNDPFQWKHLCIEEPFDLTNTAHSVYNNDVFIRIKTVFQWSFQKLKDTRSLASIFVKMPSPK